MTITRDLLRRSWKAWINSDLERTGPRWLQWAWTAVFALVLAMVFTVMAMATAAGAGPDRWTDPARWARWYGSNLVVTGCISLLIHGLYDLLIPWIGRNRIRAFSHGQRALFFTGVPLTGVVIGWPLGLWLLGGGRSPGWLAQPDRLFSAVVLGALISLALFVFFDAKARQALAEKRAVEAQLRLLQGQMEPHFLFNTLANVLTLIDLEPSRAKAMLEALTDYLRSTLAGLRHDRSTLGRELELAEAYLQLLQLRMDDRLRFVIDADHEARRAAVPPLLLQPLVENAIQHGLEPKIEGGQLRISARVVDGELCVSVRDDGLGVQARGTSRGNGVALANIRERLAALHGDAATLTVRALQPGTEAMLRLPFMAAPSPSVPNA
jgi:two-component sensor histidine kinase